MSGEQSRQEMLDDLLNKVVALKNRGQYEQAIEILDAMLEREGNAAARSNAYALRGSVKREAEMYEAAIEDFDSAIEIDPENPDFHYSRAVANVVRGEREAGIEDFGAVLELGPDDVRTRASRAETMITVGDAEAALEEATRAVELSDAPGDRAVSLLLTLVAGLVIGEPIDDWEAEYQTLCDEGVDAGWEFSQLDGWLADADLPAEKESRIRAWIDRL